MKPNNLYYRQIASKLTGKTYSKLYSNSYYARKIAEHYNEEEYTGRKPLNKYLEDWYVAVTGETAPTEHKPNLWYLRRLAKATDDSINEKTLNENQCLHIIADGDAPTPVEDAIIFEIDGNSFMSNNNSPFEYTGEVLIDWGDNTTETYNGGKLTHNYASSGEYTIKITGNITALGQTSFAGNPSKRITLSNSITSIGTYCFAGCSNLEEIILSDNLTTLEQGTIVSCPKLSSITIPNSVISIGNDCFTGDTNLETVIFPNSLLTLGDSVFGSCGKIEFINIPSSVTSIGKGCFANCNNLNEITLNWESNIVGFDSAQPYFNITQILSIPTGTTSLYEAKGYPSEQLQER